MPSTVTNLLLASLGPPVTVPVGWLKVAGSPRSAGEDADHVQALVEAEGELPPIVVQQATMRVVDGRHRLRAARIRGDRDIAVRFFAGNDADALLYAVLANVTHGLPLSIADRKAAAREILAAHPQWSDRLVASVTGLSAKTVASIRKTSAGAAPERRVGQDGRTRPVDHQERRRIADDLMRADPTLSLRQVARTVGISPETARAVRLRLRTQRGPGTAVVAASPPRSSAVDRLRADPSLRYTDFGRTLLRLLNAQAMSDEQWTTLAHAVPPHCRRTVAELATEYACTWRRFADLLEE